MKEIYQAKEGSIDLVGLQYEFESSLRVESRTLEFGRVDKIDFDGDHLVRLERDTHSLVFFSQGENLNGHSRIDGKRIPHGGRLRGKMDILPAGSEYSGIYVGGPLSAMVVSIDPQLAQWLPSVDGTLDLKPQFQLNDSFLQMMCEQFFHASDPLLKESLLLTVLVYMSRKPLEPQVATGFSVGRKRKLTDYVEAHLDRDISVRELAAEVGVSVFHFARLFKQAFLVTPYRYILQRRVERAKILLAHTSDSIETVGFRCGFNSASQFSQTFSRVAGLTPSSFRKSLA